MFPRLLGGGEPDIHCLRIPWLTDTTVQCLCYDDVDVTISLLFAMAIHVSLSEHSASNALDAVMTFKPQQRASVRYVYEGKDVFLWLPTGFGKPLCYEVLLFVFDV